MHSRVHSHCDKQTRLSRCADTASLRSPFARVTISCVNATIGAGVSHTCTHTAPLHCLLTRPQCTQCLHTVFSLAVTPQHAQLCERVSTALHCSAARKCCAHTQHADTLCNTSLLLHCYQSHFHLTTLLYSVCIVVLCRFCRVFHALLVCVTWHTRAALFSLSHSSLLMSL